MLLLSVTKTTNIIMLKSMGRFSLASSEMPLPDHEARLEISCRDRVRVLILQTIHLVNLEPYLSNAPMGNGIGATGS